MTIPSSTGRRQHIHPFIMSRQFTMKRPILFIILLVISIFDFNFCCAKKKIKTFRVSPEITTGWTFCRNQALYISDFLYSVDKKIFLKFFKELNFVKNINAAGESSRTDQSFLFNEVLHKFLPKRSEILRLLKVNLEMETAAPKFEALAQSQEKVSKLCDGKVIIEYQSGVFACSLEEFESKRKENEGGDFIFSDIKLSDFDLYFNNAENLHFIRIYTIPGSETFTETYDALVDLGYNVLIQLLVKHIKCPFYQDEVHPTGYGLEFEIKSSEYVVEEPQEEIPDDEDYSNLLKSSYFNEFEFDNNPIKSFSNIKEVSQIQGKALKHLLKSSRTNPNFKEFLKTSTNIPLISDKLKSLKSPKFSTQNVGESHFRINDLDFKPGNIDPFRILDLMNVFYKMSSEGKELDLPSTILKKLLNSRINPDLESSGIHEKRTNYYNLQSPSITFLNDLEKDKKYSNWVRSFKNEQILEEGAFHAKNILTVVFLIDFQREGISSLLENILQLISMSCPFRFAIIPLGRSEDSIELEKNDLNPQTHEQQSHALLIKAFYAIRENYGLRACVSFLQNAIRISQNQNELDHLELIEFLCKELNLKIDPNDGKEIYNESLEIIERFDLSEEDGVFVNGRLVPMTPNLIGNLMKIYPQELSISIELFADKTGKKQIDLYDELLKYKNAKNQRRSIFKNRGGNAHHKILSNINAYVSYTEDHLIPIESLKKLINIKNYITITDKNNNNADLSSWIAADFSRLEFFSFLINYLKLVLEFNSSIKSTDEDQNLKKEPTLNSMLITRIFVKNPMTSMANRIVLAAAAVLSESTTNILELTQVIEFLEEFHKNYFNHQQAEFLSENLNENNNNNTSSTDNTYNNTISKSNNYNINSANSDNPIIKKILQYANNLHIPILKEIIEENLIFFEIYNSKNLNWNENILYSINGNSLKVTINEPDLSKATDYIKEFIISEFELRTTRYFKVAKSERLTLPTAQAVLSFGFLERKLLKLLNRDLSHMISPSTEPFPSSPDSKIIIIGDSDTSIFHVEAIFNPFNREGQKFSSIMSYLTVTDLFSFSLIFTADLDSKDPKETRIYRFVTPETKGAPISIVPISDPETLMAMSLDLPSAWMTIATYSNADLDNIRPMKVPHLQASFALNHIIIEGQATFIDGGDDEIATGKVVQLYNLVTGLLEDETSVMANFGYFQLKASPGQWKMRVLDNFDSSKDCFEYPIVNNEKTSIISFGGTFKQLRISHEATKLQSSLPNKKQADINIFSLASGLFYERLLRIMILSVMKKKSPGVSVKFWLLKTTLSAQGALALDTLSKQYEFEYELMAYKWPTWLNPQIKKHRTIWAYKILFLDVLFPQDLKRIIFIDADQVIRSDLMELVELDLEGHVYAMTPFCNDKPEMAPFRFWEHNYWKNHLAGRPYHISALFVVDLLELRKKLVADIIRSQYHALSQDPNSLANLDQDLPNNLQKHIPIYSLPQEWLWCDTWCSQSTKSSAKTIDLCNNPKTFESKFDQAIRIIPEWTSYDKEITNLLEKRISDYQKNLKSTNFELSEHFEL